MTEQARERVVALEEHFTTEAYLDATRGLSIAPGEEAEDTFFDVFRDNSTMRRKMADVEDRVAEMAANGVDLTVLSLNPPGVQVWDDAARATELARRTNDVLAELSAEHPGQLSGLASVAPQDPDAAAEEVARAMGELDLAGVMISSHTHGHYLDEPQYEPLLAALEEQQATLYLHPRCPSPGMLAPFLDYGMIAALWGFQAETSTHAIRLITSGVLDRHPNLRIVLGHLGEGLPFVLWRLDNCYRKMLIWARDAIGVVELEHLPSEYIGRNFAVTTSGMIDYEVLQYTLTKLGAEHVMFAVDSPYEDIAEAAEFLRAADLDDEQRRLISHGTAESWFRLPPDPARDAR